MRNNRALLPGKTRSIITQTNKLLYVTGLHELSYSNVHAYKRLAVFHCTAHFQMTVMRKLSLVNFCSDAESAVAMDDITDEYPASDNYYRPTGQSLH